MGYRGEWARRTARQLIDRVAVRGGSRLGVRLAGAAVAAGGLALMGFGTIGSPLSAGALASPDDSGQAITNITVSCSNLLTSGTLSVSDAVSGNKVTLEVFAHNPGGTWSPTGATETITMAAGTSDYNYSISGVPASFADGTVTGDDGNDSLDPDSPGDDYNAWRVQVSSTVGTFDGTTTKSASYECPGTATTTSSSTSSSTHSTTSSTTSSSTSSSSKSSTSSSSSSSSTPTTSSSSSSTSSTSTSSSTSSKSSTSSTSSTSSATAPESSTTTSSSTTSSEGSSTSSSSSSSTAPASTSTTSTPGTGVGAASTPSTGAADGEFGIGLGLLIAGGGLVAGAARIGRRPKK